MFKKIAFICMMLLLGVTLIACNGDTISFAEPNVEIEVGEKYDLSPVLSKTSLKINYTMDKDDVITIEGGKVTGVAAGIVKVTATIDGTDISATITITVVEKQSETPTISFKDEDVELEIGEEYTLNPTLSNSELVVIYSADPMSSVELTGNKVKALIVGTVTITATITDTEVSATIQIKIVEEQVAPTISFDTDIVELEIGEEYTLVPDLSNNKLEVVYSAAPSEKVSFAGNKVKALAAGDVIITATIKNTEIKATKTLQIKEKTTLSFESDNITIDLGVTNEVVLVPTITGENIIDLLVAYEIANDEIISIENNTVKGLKVGTTSITAKIIGTNVETVITVNVINTTTLTVETITTIAAGDTHKLVVTDSADKYGIGVMFESSDSNILTVTSTGTVKGINGGVATITITSLSNGKKLSFDVTVTYQAATGLTIGFGEKTYETENSYKGIFSVEPRQADQEIIFSSNNPDIAYVNDFGYLVTGTVTGNVAITGKVASNEEITMVINITVEEKFDPMKIIESLHETKIINQEMILYGWEYTAGGKYPVQPMLGSVSKFLFEDLVITPNMMKSTAVGYTGVFHAPKTRFITYHDTGAAGAGSTALANSNYNNSDAEVSWHFTVGDDAIYQQLPTNMVAWHAGDGTGTKFEEIPTGVKFNGNLRPTVTITTDGYFALDGEKTTYLAPTKSGVIAKTSDINDNGLFTIVKDGYYYMGTTWYSSDYRYISNKGGNNNAIGIEMAINSGSDLYSSYHHLAKLIGKLMEDNNLGIADVQPHHFFSGKNCPGTMRNARIEQHFLEMVEAEYLVRTKLKGYTLDFSTTANQYVDSRGRIFNLPTVATPITYKVRIQHAELHYDATVVLETILPAKSDLAKPTNRFGFGY